MAASTSTTTTTTGTFVLPGDPLPALTALLKQQEAEEETSPSSKSNKKKALRLGAGLALSPHTPSKPVQPYRAGELRINPRRPAAYVESVPRRYTPTPPDPVLATLIRQTAEAYVVQLTSYTPPATIPLANFSTSSSTNATARKTRPNLSTGALLYATVTTVHKHLESPELSVPDGDEWGEVKGGYVFDISQRMVRTLLDADGEGKVLLDALGHKNGFEMILGRNGRCWVDAKEVEEVWRVTRCIKEYDEGKMWEVLEGKGEEEVKEVVGRMVRGIFGK